MITIPFSTEEFNKVKTQLELNPEITTKKETDDNNGEFSTNEVTLGYSFDGANLNLTVLAKHGIAKFASENTIKQHIEQLLKTI